MMETDKDVEHFEFDRYDTYEWYLTLGAALERQRAGTSRARCRRWNDFVAHPDYDAFWKRQSMIPYLTRVDGADAERRRLVRPGGLLRAAHDLRRAREARRQRTRTSWSSARGTTAAGRTAPGERSARSTSAATPAEYFREACRRRSSPTTSRTRARPTSPRRSRSRPARTSGGSCDAWPPKKDAKVRGRCTSRENGKLSFEPPAAAGDAFDAFVSDPAQPVPYRQRPDRADLLPGGSSWSVVAGRGPALRATTVPTSSPARPTPLTEDVVIAGQGRRAPLRRHHRHATPTGS